MPGDGRPRFDPDEFARSAAPLNPLSTRKPRNDTRGDSPWLIVVRTPLPRTRIPFG